MNTFIKSVSHFSSYNKRSKVPKLLKDFKYTRKGVMKVKQKQWSHDLSSPYVVDSHLYYDQEKEFQKQQAEIQIKETIRQQKIQKLNLTVDQCLLMELKDRQFVRMINQPVISKMQTLLQDYPQVLKDNQEMFQSILQKTCSKFFQLDVDQVSVVAQIYQISGCNDPMVQKRLIQAIQKSVAFVNHHQEIEPETKTKLQELIKLANELNHEQTEKLNADLQQDEFIKQALA